MDSIPQKIINTYKIAWEFHCIELLEVIFSNNIIYQEKCSNVIHGLQNLKNYWLENSLKQRDVHFNVNDLVYHEQNIILDWEASFFDLKINKKTSLSGIIWIKLDDVCKIVHFKEFFNLKRYER